jgi:hypothetical protein
LASFRDMMRFTSVMARAINAAEKRESRPISHPSDFYVCMITQKQPRESTYLLTLVGREVGPYSTSSRTHPLPYEDQETKAGEVFDLQHISASIHHSSVDHHRIRKNGRKGITHAEHGFGSVERKAIVGRLERWCSQKAHREVRPFSRCFFMDESMAQGRGGYIWTAKVSRKFPTKHGRLHSILWGPRGLRWIVVVRRSLEVMFE